MKKDFKLTKKRMFKIIASLLVVFVFLGTLTSCGKQQYVDKAKEVFSINQGTYKLTLEMKDTQNKNTQTMKVLLSGKLNKSDDKCFLTSDISLDLYGNGSYVECTDVIINEKGFYLNLDKLAEALKTMYNVDTFNKAIDNLKIQENQYLYISYEDIYKENGSDFSEKDLNTIADAFDETFTKDFKNLISDMKITSYEKDEVIITIDKDNAKELIGELREYIDTKFEKTFNEFLEKIKDISNESLKSDMKEVKENIIEFSKKDLKEYEKNYESKLKEEKVNDFDFVSKVSCDEKTGKISFVANTDVEDAKTKISINYVVKNEKVDKNSFSSPENVISYEELLKKLQI